MQKIKSLSIPTPFLFGGLGALIVILALWLSYPAIQAATFPGHYESNYEKALAMNAQGKYAGSTYLLLNSYSQAPNLGLGQTIFHNYLAEGQTTSAINFGKKLLAKYPDSHDFRIELANTMADQKQFTAAKSLLQEGIESYHLDIFNFALAEVAKKEKAAN